VIDSSQSGNDSGMILNGQANNIPILDNLENVILRLGAVPEFLIYGLAPSSGQLSQLDRTIITRAIGHGMNIVSGLHEFLGDDAELKRLAQTNQVTLHDIRKPKPNHALRVFDGSVERIRSRRIAVLGTDCAIGKRTTAILLSEALNVAKIKTTLVTTGQTGLMQGNRFGIVMDALPSQFCAGELEGCIIEAALEEDPEVIVIEGQGALSHPAFCTSGLILRGSKPDAVILQHSPTRKYRCDFPTMKLPDLADEIQMIETFSDVKVIGITINHEGISTEELPCLIEFYKKTYGLPVCDALQSPKEDLASMVTNSFNLSKSIDRNTP
jgi:uncharacterized NAD-dependent epimerase/dehydratase family protein